MEGHVPMEISGGVSPLVRMTAAVVEKIFLSNKVLLFTDNSPGPRVGSNGNRLETHPE
jgi:hypothetical protein